MKREQTGNEDQRYITRDDHDAARRWFERTYKAPKEKILTAAERKANLRRLREMVEERLTNQGEMKK